MPTAPFIFPEGLNLFNIRQVHIIEPYWNKVRTDQVKGRARRIESHINLKIGDYVLCGIKNEKYGLPLEKILNIYELGNIESKPVIRKGFKLTKKNIEFIKRILITH